MLKENLELLHMDQEPSEEGLEKRVYRAIDTDGQLVAIKLYRDTLDVYADEELEELDKSKTTQLEVQDYRYFLGTRLSIYIPIPRNYITDKDGNILGFSLEWKEGVPIYKLLPEDYLSKEELSQFEQDLLSQQDENHVPTEEMLETYNICVTPRSKYNGVGSRIWFAECESEPVDGHYFLKVRAEYPKAVRSLINKIPKLSTDQSPNDDKAESDD